MGIEEIRKNAPDEVRLYHDLDKLNTKAKNQPLRRTFCE